MEILARFTFQDFQKAIKKVCPQCSDEKSPKPGSSDCIECFWFWRAMEIKKENGGVSVNK